jgi:Na+/H+ antiporter NhaC
MPDALAANWLSILPAAVAILLAFATRQVIAALFAGVLAAAVVLFLGSGQPADLNPVERLFLPALGTKNFAQILFIYLWCLGGLVGLWGKTGGARHFAEWISNRVARDRRSALVVSWLIGIVFHQGGTVSTVLTGTTVKPVADRHRVSHEELSYVVDSTASPIATLIPFNAWPYYVAGLVVGTIPLIPDTEAAFVFFLGSIPYNFYALVAVFSTLLLALGLLPWKGSGLRQAARRAQESGALDAPGSEPLIPPESELNAQDASYQPSLADFFVPLGVLLGVGIGPYIVWGSYHINEAFLSSTLAGMLTARVRGMQLSALIDGFLAGCRSMTIGAIVLALAVTLGFAARELGTAGYVVSLLGDWLPAAALPALLTVLCMGIAFSTGTSWGTYAVVFPVALPLAYALAPDPLYVHICFGAVLGGAVFGDQCSPISDTTILASMFTGCDLMDHVRTQIFPALTAAGIGALLSGARARASPPRRARPSSRRALRPRTTGRSQNRRRPAARRESHRRIRRARRRDARRGSPPRRRTHSGHRARNGEPR